jgi:two-component system response regulator QseB
VGATAIDVESGSTKPDRQDSLSAAWNDGAAVPLQIVSHTTANILHRNARESPMRILLAEDDAMIGESLCRGLRQDGFTVDWVRDGRAAELALAERVHDLLLLDLGLPRKQGLDVLGGMRRRGDSRPVLIITARDAVADRVAGLDSGADDYLVKPFELDELSARIRALLRRGAGRASAVVRYGGIELEPATHAVRVDGEAVSLSAREFALIEALLARPGATMSRAQLEEKLYGWNEPVESNAVEVHIHSLRKKLGAERIRNVRGVGWRVAQPDATLRSHPSSH